MKIAHIKYQANHDDTVVYVDAESVTYAAICPSEEETAVITLYDNGTICECNKAAAMLLDSAPNKLTWQHISNFLPRLIETPLMQGETINPNLRFLSRVGYSFEVISMNGVHFACTLFFNEIENFGRHYLRLIFRPIAPEYTMA
jgi:hypothetical protein